MGQTGFTPAKSAAVITSAPGGVVTCLMRPQATGLRTKRTHFSAGRSAVNRPSPVTSVLSSTRRMERPVHCEPGSGLGIPSGTIATHLTYGTAHCLHDVLIACAPAQI